MDLGAESGAEAVAEEVKRLRQVGGEGGGAEVHGEFVAAQVFHVPVVGGEDPGGLQQVGGDGLFQHGKESALVFHALGQVERFEPGRTRPDHGLGGRAAAGPLKLKVDLVAPGGKGQRQQWFGLLYGLGGPFEHGGCFPKRAVGDGLAKTSGLGRQHGLDFGDAGDGEFVELVFGGGGQAAEEQAKKKGDSHETGDPGAFHNVPLAVHPLRPLHRRSSACGSAGAADSLASGQKLPKAIVVKPL